MALAELATASYVSIESYRRNGDAVRTPVWIVQEAGLLYCWTMLSSGKVKRIRRNSKVKLAACDARGKIRGDWVEASARVLDGDAEIKAQAKAHAAEVWLEVFALSRPAGAARKGQRRHRFRAARRKLKRPRRRSDMVRYRIEMTIELPRDRVIELFDSFDNLKKWQKALLEVEHLSGEPGEPGAKTRLVYAMGKRKMVMTETILTRNLPDEFSGTYDAWGAQQHQSEFLL